MRKIDPLQFISTMEPEYLTPDWLVGFSNYAMTMQIEAAKRSVETGERIPVAAVWEAIGQAFPHVQIDELRMWAFAGTMVQWDRDGGNLPDEAWMAEFVDDDAEEIIRQVQQQRDEVEMLNEWFDL